MATTKVINWITTPDGWLSESQSLNNAQMVVNHFVGSDWTKEALAALCGNMRHESSINPNIFEFGYGHSLDRGYGLVQWTPASKYVDWATARGLNWQHGDSQLARIDYEADKGIQWIADGHRRRYGRSSKYNFSFSNFRRNSPKLSVAQLTEAFMWNYEGPNYTAGSNSLADRIAFAQKAYNQLDFGGVPDGGGGGGGSTPSPSKPKPTTPKPPQYKYEKEALVNNMAYITVKKGDTLSEIAKKYDVPLSSIKEVVYKDIRNPNLLEVGEILKLPIGSKVPKQPVPTPPANGGSTKPSVPSPSPAPSVAKTYKVRKGDTLSEIADKHDTTVSHLKAKNNIINTNLIYTGQILKV